MNGIINVNKPPKMTSHDVVSYFRKLFNIKKIGHTGTLDPDASGVLPICIGKATKISDYLTSERKKYRAKLQLGISTDTQDSSGNVLAKKDVVVSINQINEILNLFLGKIKQIPPMYSAIKVDGKKLYQLAREGKTIDRKEREIEIFNIELINYDDNTKNLLLDIDCSKGTYIRTLCNDIGEKLGCGGHMSQLIRTASGNYKLENSYTLDEIKKLFEQNNIDEFLDPIESIFEEYTKIILKNDSKKWVQNGAQIYLKDITDKIDLEGQKFVRVYDENNNFLALYRVICNNTIEFVPEKMFI